jgi:hypothetical protein
LQKRNTGWQKQGMEAGDLLTHSRKELRTVPATSRSQAIIKERASDEMDFLGRSRFYRGSYFFGAVHRRSADECECGPAL